MKALRDKGYKGPQPRSVSRAAELLAEINRREARKARQAQANADRVKAGREYAQKRAAERAEAEEAMGEVASRGAATVGNVRDAAVDLGVAAADLVVAAAEGARGGAEGVVQVGIMAVEESAKSLAAAAASAASAAQDAAATAREGVREGIKTAARTAASRVATAAQLAAAGAGPLALTAASSAGQGALALASQAGQKAYTLAGTAAKALGAAAGAAAGAAVGVTGEALKALPSKLATVGRSGLGAALVPAQYGLGAIRRGYDVTKNFLGMQRAHMNMFRHLRNESAEYRRRADEQAQSRARFAENVWQPAPLSSANVAKSVEVRELQRVREREAAAERVRQLTQTIQDRNDQEMRMQQQAYDMYERITEQRQMAARLDFIRRDVAREAGRRGIAEAQPANERLIAGVRQRAGARVDEEWEMSREMAARREAFQHGAPVNDAGVSPLDAYMRGLELPGRAPQLAPPPVPTVDAFDAARNPAAAQRIAMSAQAPVGAAPGIESPEGLRPLALLDDGDARAGRGPRPSARAGPSQAASAQRNHMLAADEGDIQEMERLFQQEQELLAEIESFNRGGGGGGGGGDQGRSRQWR